MNGFAYDSQVSVKVREIKSRNENKRDFPVLPSYVFTPNENLCKLKMQQLHTMLYAFWQIKRNNVQTSTLYQGNVS